MSLPTETLDQYRCLRARAKLWPAKALAQEYLTVVDWLMETLPWGSHEVACAFAHPQTGVPVGTRSDCTEVEEGAIQIGGLLLALGDVFFRAAGAKHRQHGGVNLSIYRIEPPPCEPRTGEPYQSIATISFFAGRPAPAPGPGWFWYTEEYVRRVHRGMRQQADAEDTPGLGFGLIEGLLASELPEILPALHQLQGVHWHPVHQWTQIQK